MYLQIRSDGFNNEEFVALAQKSIAAAAALPVQTPSDAPPRDEMEAWLRLSRLALLQP